MLVGATFFITDGIQSIAVGALRGMNDTRMPLLFAAISYWLIGFPLAYVLGFWTSSAPSASGSGCRGTAVYATLLILRFGAGAQT